MVEKPLPLFFRQQLATEKFQLSQEESRYIVPSSLHLADITRGMGTKQSWREHKTTDRPIMRQTYYYLVLNAHTHIARTTFKFLKTAEEVSGILERYFYWMLNYILQSPNVVVERSHPKTIRILKLIDSIFAKTN